MVLPLLWYPVRQQNESNEENTILNAENRTPAKKCKQWGLHNEVFLQFMGNVSKVSLHKSLENSNNDYRYDNGVD